MLPIGLYQIELRPDDGVSQMREPERPTLNFDGAEVSAGLSVARSGRAASRSRRSWALPQGARRAMSPATTIPRPPLRSAERTGRAGGGGSWPRSPEVTSVGYDQRRFRSCWFPQRAPWVRSGAW